MLCKWEYIIWTSRWFQSQKPSTGISFRATTNLKVLAIYLSNLPLQISKCLKTDGKCTRNMSLCNRRSRNRTDTGEKQSVNYRRAKRKRSKGASGIVLDGCGLPCCLDVAVQASITGSWTTHGPAPIHVAMDACRAHLVRAECEVRCMDLCRVK